MIRGSVAAHQLSAGAAGIRSSKKTWTGRTRCRASLTARSRTWGGIQHAGVWRARCSWVRRPFLARPTAANEDRRIKLGCVQPGETPAVFGDALRHLAQAATYLYQDNARYWYATQPTVTKLADDRAEQLRREPDRVGEEIQQRVRDESAIAGRVSEDPSVPRDQCGCAGRNGNAAGGPGRGQAVREGNDNLAIEGSREPAEPARQQSAHIQNTLVFLAADRNRLDELDAATRYFLAWQSIGADKETLNLDKSQTKQATTQKNNWDGTVESRIGETFQWLLVPTQPNPQGPVEWQADAIGWPGPAGGARLEEAQERQPDGRPVRLDAVASRNGQSPAVAR